MPQSRSFIGQYHLVALQKLSEVLNRAPTGPGNDSQLELEDALLKLTDIQGGSTNSRNKLRHDLHSAAERSTCGNFQATTRHANSRNSPYSDLHNFLDRLIEINRGEAKKLVDSVIAENSPAEYIAKRIGDLREGDSVTIGRESNEVRICDPYLDKVQVEMKRTNNTLTIKKPNGEPTPQFTTKTLIQSPQGAVEIKNGAIELKPNVIVRTELATPLHFTIPDFKSQWASKDLPT